jgi:hypothetical protein
MPALSCVPGLVFEYSLGHFARKTEALGDVSPAPVQYSLRTRTYPFWLDLASILSHRAKPH